MNKKDIEAIYPLSTVQQGMLFHTLYAPESGEYFVAGRLTLRGPLQVAGFREAWQQLADRNPVLRAAVMWEGLKEPLQVVRRGMKLPWQEHDWRGLSAAEREERLEDFLRKDRQQGFELSKGPLTRLTLVRVAEDVYELLWSFHHLLLDGWSVYLLLNEVFLLYEAAADERQPALETRRPYRDYIAFLRMQDASEAEVFWRKTLKGFTAPTPLGADRRASGSLATEEGYSYEETQLSEAATAALQSLARQHRLTLNTVIQGAWALLLSRYSGQQDVVFGATFSHRPEELAGVERMVGLFINTLPVRAQARPDSSLVSWLTDLQQRQVELRQFGYSPLAQVQGWSEVPRGTPLFESILVFENYLADDSFQGERGRLDIHRHRFFEKTSYPLTVVAWPGPRLSLRIMYRLRSFDPAAIVRMRDHLRTVLESMVANPEGRLRDLGLLTEAERHQLVVEWNDTEADYPREKCIHELFEAQAQRTPGAIAVVSHGEQLSYRQVNARANRLARHLRGLGVGPEVLVGLCVERSPEMVVGLLGILKAGGAYMPLDPADPKERLAFMLENARAPVVVSREELLEKLPEHAARVVCLDRDWPAIAKESEKNPDGGATADNLVYVIYTSGSTGKPKGVGIEHRSLTNLVAWHQRAYTVTPTDRATQLAGLAFDASVWEIWPYLASGASIHIPNEEIRLSPPKLLEWISAEAITICFVPTPLAEAVLEQPPPTGLALRTLLTGGDKLHAGPRQARPFELINHYGPTENTVVTTSALVGAGGDPGTPPPIGRPIANMQTYILDRNRQPVPVGVPGELCIGGAGLARGYLHLPGLTAEKFLPNPLSNATGERLYATGDLARYRPDGRIDFLGRIDQQVKVRGFRIELGEIEAILSRHPEVRDCVVLAREDVPGEKRLVAYLVVEKEREPDVTRLRSFLRESLPEYMVPSAFVMLDELPLTPNGKLDRRALPAPETSRSGLEEAYVAPRTPAEQALAGIWRDVLRLAQVGVHDNFFELGGDSILSIQIVARANQAGLRLSPRQLFERPTIAELATVAGMAEAVEAEQGLIRGSVPLTAIQHWFFEQDFPDPHHWNMPMLLELREAYAPDVLEKAISALLNHHDALRMRFRQGESGWEQGNGGPEEARVFTTVDLSALSEMEQEAVFERTAGKLQKSLNLSEGPLLRAALFERGAGKPQRLLLVLHHLAVDGVSWRILLEDLQTACRQLSRGEPVAFPRKSTSFQQWSRRLAEHAQSGALERELAYWLSEGREQVCRLPVDFPAGVKANTEGSARTVSVCLGAEETRALLQEVPDVYRTLINDVLLTALLQAFEPWTGGAPLRVDLEGHGREEVVDGVDLSRTVGWFTAVFPVRLELPQGEAPGEALKAVKEQLRRIPNRGIGYGLLRYLGGNEQGLRLAALADAEVSFNYLGQLDSTFAQSSAFVPARHSAGASRSPRQRRSHLLELNGKVAGGRLEMDWIYSENVHRRQTVEGLASRFVEKLQGLITHCRSAKAGSYTPSDFPDAALSEEKLEKVFAELALPATPEQSS